MKSIHERHLKKLVFAWAVCFLALLSFYFLMLAPQEKYRIHTRQTLIRAKQSAQTARRAANTQNRDGLLDKVARMEQTLREFLFEVDNVANLTFDIDRIFNDIELSSSSITSTGSAEIEEIENCDYLFSKDMDVDFASDFNKFAAFVNALEESRPAIFIDQFEIIRSGQSNTAHKVSMKLAVLVDKGA